jgi:hypothetical protein
MLIAGACASMLRMAVADDGFVCTTGGGAGSPPPAAYAPPMIANGSLCMQVDFRGGQTPRTWAKMVPGIFRAGRRHEPVGDAGKQLVPFGRFEHELAVAGKPAGEPAAWTQTLDTKAATTTCRNEHDGGLVVETTVFVPLDFDLVVVRKRLSTDRPLTGPARLAFRYVLAPPGETNRAPRRMTCESGWTEATASADFRFTLDAYQPCEGIISVFADRPVTASVTGQTAVLSADFAPAPGAPAEITFFLSFADSLDGSDWALRAAGLRGRVRREGFDGLLDAHRRAWAAYWGESRVSVPDPSIQRAYCTAQYHLRANATRWSFPVGIFPTHWAGKFFGWDETFCHQALIGSNHRDIARRCPEFRFAGLPKALQRASHYGRPGRYGARYPWETLEDGAEGSPPGFWMEHVFHISNIALSAWQQYLYTGDAAYLRNTGYPVVRECARFFVANMVYQKDDGGMFLGKCTDLERLGPSRERAFMTTCGAIYTLEAAAQAADRLGEDAPEAAEWRRVAAKLRDSLPHDGTKYVPYPGCTERSIAALGGIFPYPVFDADEERQRRAVLDFVAEGRASGNMYPVGDSVCAWYAGWMAAALAVLGEGAEAGKLLSEAAAGAGCFGELFEINEAKVSMRPWFSTASGNFVFALNQLLIQSRGDEIRIAPAVPASWKDYAFTLPCHGDLVAEVVVAGGRLARLTLLPGPAAPESRRTLVVPKGLLEGARTDAPAVTGVEERDGCRRLAVRVYGRTDIVAAKPPE